MIADLKPYPAYRESGSLWLGAVPSHWEVQNLRTLIRPYNERNRTDLPLLSVAREKGVFVRSLTDAGENHNVIPEDLSNYKVARAGNLVINKMKAWQGSMGIAPCDGIVSPAYFVFNFTIANRSFGQALLRSKPYVAHFGQASDGVRVGQWDLTIRGMRQIPILLPPPDEQAAIVRFLGWANGQLEKAIRAKRRVITLLNEQKQVIIHRAVTRGLDPSVLFKPSGIPWLGDIPEHWEVRKLRTLFHTQGSGTTPSGDHYYGGSINWVMSGDLNDSVIKKTKRTVHGKALIAYSTLKLYPENSIVVAMYGATIGKTGILGVAACTNQACCVFAQAMPTVNVFLIQLIIQTAKPHLLRAAYGGGQPNINADVVRSLRIPFPPIKEQDAILAHVELETSRLTTAISRFEREIELLREYRTRLVADVVTGKLDVREAAAKLPDEALIDLPDNDSVEALEDEPFEEEALV